tara:strand:+ start:1778 stop:2752 length:975 start_codon:yes stop_codon:yes gene_type:complete
MTSSSLPEHYDIGAICRLTGVNAPNLRMWEKRYSVVEPARSETGRRLYSSEDLERLKLLKSLVDTGHAIGNIASLPNEALKERISQQAAADASQLTKPSADEWPRSLIIIGSRLAELCFGTGPAFPGVVLKGRYPTPDHAVRELTGDECDLLLVAVPTLFEKDLEQIKGLALRIRSRRTIIIYDFAPSAVLAPLTETSERLIALKGPVDVERLRLAWRSQPDAHSAESDIDPEERSAPPQRRFSNEQLTYLSSVSIDLKCECPHHLSGLISSLVSFESYSEQCENQSQEDARLHSRLHAATAQARVIMEDALQDLLTVEEIALE